MKKKLILIAFLITSFSACDKEIYNPIPYAPVYYTLNLNFLDNDLVPVLATKSITKPRTQVEKLGYGGLLIINGIGNNATTNLYAFDLTCPVEIDKKIKVIADNAGNATCQQCGEKYNIGSGTGIPTFGISKHPLKQYTVNNTGNNQFRISN